MVVGVGDALRCALRLHGMVQTTGVVSEMVSQLAPEGSVVSLPHVRFDRRDAGGGIVEFTPLAISRFSSDLTAGEQVAVAYPKDRPQAAELATVGQVYGLAIVISATGMVIFDLGCVLWFLVREQSMPKMLGPRGPSRNEQAFSSMFRGGRQS
jgi:hypothetical protein